MKRWLKTLIGAAGGALLLSAFLAAVYRSYGPGTLDERLARLERRWRPFVDPEVAGPIWRFIGRGLVTTLQAALIAIALSLVFGTILALMRLARHRSVGVPGPPALRALVGAPATVLVQSVRSLPLFLLVIYSFIAAPRLGLNLTALRAGILALTVYTSCVLAEIIRAGILSLDRGQFEAADALGLGYVKKLRFVVLPQAMRRMVPSIVSQLVTLIKDTSLLSFITVIELSRRIYIVQQQSFNPIEAFAVAGAIYFVINFALSVLARRLEVKPMRVAAGTAELQGIGAEDQALVGAKP